MNQTSSTGQRVTKIQRTSVRSNEKKKVQRNVQKEFMPESLSIIQNTYQKFNQLLMSRGFYRLAIFKNEKQSKEITTRYFINTLKRKTTSDQIYSMNKLRKASDHRKAVLNFSKYLHYVEQLKATQWKKLFFLKLKFQNLILNSEKDIPINSGQKNQHKPKLNASESNISRRPPIKKEINKSVSSVKLQKTEIDTSFLPQQVSELKKQNEQLKKLQLAEETRDALMKAQRFDRFIYSKQTEKVCKQPLYNEMKRIQKLKNMDKKLRGKFFDNQLTVTALYNHIKLISEMNRQIGDLNSYKNEIEKEQQRKKKEKFQAALQAKKNKSFSSHSQNVETQMKKMMNEIDQALKEKEFLKGKKLILNFLKKYEKEEFAQERVHFYYALSESIENYEQIELCLNEVCKILQTLGVVNLEEVDAFLKSLKANYKDFHFLSNKYKNSEKQHGKQMANALNNLLQFNDVIINYLEVKKKQQKDSGKVKEKDPLVFKYEEEIKKLNIERQKQTKRITTLTMELEKEKKKNEKLQQEQNEYKNHKKLEKEFDKRISVILEKMDKKIDISRDLEGLRTNQSLKLQKPFSHFILFEEGLEHNFDERIIKEVTQIERLLGNIGKVFHKSNLTHEKRFSQIARILEVSGKKDPHLSQLHKSIENLMVTVVDQTQNSNEKQRSNSEKQKLQKSLSAQKLRVQKLQEEVKSLRDSRTDLKNPPRPKGSHSQVKKTENQVDKKQFTLIQSELQKQKEKNNILQTEVKEYQQKFRVYNLCEKRIRVIMEKIQNESNWNRQFEALKKDEKLKDEIFVQILILLKENEEAKRDEKVKQSAQKIQILLKDVNQITLKSISYEKKLLEIQKLFEKNCKLNSSFESVYFVLEQWIKNTSLKTEGETSSPTEKNFENVNKKLKQENLKLKEQIEKMKLENKKLKDENHSEQRKVENIKKQINNLEQKISQKDVIIENLGKKQREKSPQKENQKIVNELKDLKEDKRKMIENQKHIERLKKETGRYILNISKSFESKSFEKVQRQIRSLIQIYEKQQIYVEIVELLQNFLILIKEKDVKIENQQKTPEKKFSRTPEKKKQSNLTKVMRRAEGEVRKNKHLEDPEFWNQFRVTDDSEADYIDAFLKVMNIWSQEIGNKNNRIEHLVEQINKEKLSVKNLITVMKVVQTTLTRKQYFQSDECWEQIIEQQNNPDQLFSEIFKIIKKFSSASRDKILEERKKNEKSIKSYEHELMKINNLVSSLQNKLSEKNKEVEELRSTISEGKNLTRSPSLSKSRKSLRPSNSEKDLQIKNLKSSMQNFAKEQKNMLNKLESLEKQKEKLHKTIDEYELSFKKQSSQIQFFEQDKLALKVTLQREFEIKENQLIEKINSIAQERQDSIAKFQQDFHKIQTQLQREISYLKSQVQQKTQVEKVQTHQTELKTEFEMVVAQLTTLKSEQSKIIESEVILALKNQQSDFNRFLEQQNLERQQYYEKVVIPERIQEYIKSRDQSENSIVWESQYLKLLNQFQELKRVHEIMIIERQNELKQSIISEEITNIKTELHLVQEKYQQLLTANREKELQYENLKQDHNLLIQKYESEIKIQMTPKKNELTIPVSTPVKQKSGSRQNSASKSDYEEKYRMLEHRSTQQISDLKEKIQIIAKSEESELKLLKEVIFNQKIQLSQLQLMVRSAKEGKEELQKQKEDYFLEIQKILKEKSSQILSIKSEYETRIAQITNEKFSLEHRVREFERTEGNLSHNKIFEMQNQLTNKNIQILHLEDLVEKKKVQLEEERRRALIFEREVQNFKLVKTTLESHIYRLESDISLLTNENNRCKENVRDLEGRQLELRNEFIRVQTESDVENTQSLREEIKNLKKQIMKISNQRQGTSVQPLKIKRLLKDIQIQRSSDKFEYDEAELQILRKIQVQVSELVETNRQLETKIIIIQGYIDSNQNIVNSVNFILLLQHRMEQLMTFLLEKDIISTTDEYNRFVFHSRKSLSMLNFQEYFGEWAKMMKNVFISVSERKSEELRKKAEELMELKDQMTEILDKQIQYNEDENFETLEKYKMIFTDIKFLLREYLKGGDSEYLNMICRSLGFEHNEY